MAARTVTRRTVLKWTGVGVGAVVVAGAAGAGIRGALNGGFSPGSGDPYELWAQWPGLTGLDRVVAAGVLACNPHNTQPWTIAVEGEDLTVSSDPSRRMPVNDAMAREHFAGIGCAVESMVVAAGAAGHGTTVTVFPDGESSDVVARISVQPDAGAVRDSALAAAIPLRHTNRGAYRAQALTAAELDGLPLGQTGVPGVGVTWITQADARAALGRLYVEATTAIVNDPEQSAEAFAWFRNDRADIERSRDGLTLDCQGLDDLTLFLAKVLPAQSRSEGDAFWVRSTRDVHTATAAAYGIITVSDVAARSEQVNGGRLLTRVHLAATASGLGLHHMNQITERIDRVRALGTADEFSDRWSAITGVPAANGLLSFRIGHPERDARPSPRRELADVVRR